jgi:hypothetical protein
MPDDYTTNVLPGDNVLSILICERVFFPVYCALQGTHYGKNINHHKIKIIVDDSLFSVD